MAYLQLAFSSLENQVVKVYATAQISRCKRIIQVDSGLSCCDCGIVAVGSF